MPPSARELYDQYQPLHESYQAQAKELERKMLDCIEAAGVRKSIVSARAKEPLELFKKQLRKKYADPWESCPDIVAARVIVGTAGEKSDVVDSLHASEVFTVLRTEDQKEGADPSEIRYRGLHVHVSSAAATRPDGERLQCEVQIRTTAEHAWAETEHRYIYKKGEVDSAVKRHFNRLLVLMELFDLQLEEGVRMARELDDFRRLELAQALEAAITQFTRIPSDSALTINAISDFEALGLGSPPELMALVEVYIRDHRPTVEQVLAEIGPSAPAYDVGRDWIATQGEMFLLLALLEADEYKLSNALQGSDWYSPAESLALASGHSGFLRD